MQFKRCKAARGILIDRRQHRLQRTLLNITKHSGRDMQRCPVNAPVFPDKPAGKGTPYIIDTCDLSCAEEIFLYKTYTVFDRALTFRIIFVADPEFQFLLCAEVLKNTSLDDFAVSFTGDKHGVLIDNQNGRPAAKLAEAPVDCLTGFYGIILMILRIDTQQP